MQPKFTITTAIMDRHQSVITLIWLVEPSGRLIIKGKLNKKTDLL